LEAYVVGCGIRFVAYFRVSMDRSGLDLQAQRETILKAGQLPQPS
jgi:hypothetical protein